MRSQAVSALTAPAPHHTHPVRFVWVRNRPLRTKLLDEMRSAWRDDLRGDEFTAEQIERRVARGDLLYGAQEIVLPFLVPDGQHTYPDQRRNTSEHTMFTVAAGGAVQGLLVALLLPEDGEIVLLVALQVWGLHCGADHLPPRRTAFAIGPHLQCV